MNVVCASWLGIPVYKNPHVPLTTTNSETGEITQVLCWKIDGKINVHPDRWERFLRGVAMQDIVVAPEAIP